MKPNFEFETSFETGGFIAHNIGRLFLGKGEKSSIVRILFTPDGTKLLISREAEERGNILWTEKSEYYESLSNKST